MWWLFVEPERVDGLLSGLGGWMTHRNQAEVCRAVRGSRDGCNVCGSHDFSGLNGIVCGDYSWAIVEF